VHEIGVLCPDIPSRVVTSSLANGPLVLRHELGHSIIDIGEEYDGGSEYYGVNSAKDLTSPLPWHHWLSLDPGIPPRIERSVMPLQTYPVIFHSTIVSFKKLIELSGHCSTLQQLGQQTSRLPAHTPGILFVSLCLGCLIAETSELNWTVSSFHGLRETASVWIGGITTYIGMKHWSPGITK
jgi:hypothetical protein